MMKNASNVDFPGECIEHWIHYNNLLLFLQYEYSYVMTVNMGGTNNADGTILCSVASDILKSHFAMDASEMRDLQKADPSKCQRIVQEGGLKFKASLVTMSSWQLQLVQSATDFFDGTAQNGKNPILQLTRRIEGG